MKTKSRLKRIKSKRNRNKKNLAKLASKKAFWWKLATKAQEIEEQKLNESEGLAEMTELFRQHVGSNKRVNASLTARQTQGEGSPTSEAKPLISQPGRNADGV